MIKAKLGDMSIEIGNYEKVILSDDSITIYSSSKKILHKEEEHNKYVIGKKTDTYIKNDFLDDTPDYLKQNNSPIGDNFSYEAPYEESKQQIQNKQDEYDNSILRDGAVALRGMVEGWAVGYRQETEQPDRQRILLDTIDSDGGKVLKYINHTGGLTHAIVDCTEMSRELARDIAMNICQVSSIIFPPLAETCEFKFKT